MAGPAAIQERFQPKVVTEEYGRSLVAMRHGGELLVKQQVSVEYLIEETEMFPDFKTAVKEMLKNDLEFSDQLELNNRREHDIVDGKVVNAKDQPMVDVLDNGRVASSLLAEQDKAYDYQVSRDEADIRMAEEVDELSEGQTRWGVSKDPKKAILKHPEIYKKRFGYKEGLIYLQFHSKAGGKVITGSYAIDCHQPHVLRPILAEHDMVIPADESDDTWLDHAVNAEMSADQADAFAQSIRREYYERIGESTSRVSVDEFVDEHEEILAGFFKAYYPDMAMAVVTEENQPSMQQLAAAMLTKNTEKLKPGIITELIRIRNKSKLDDAAVKVMDSIVRYATVEELRKFITPRFTSYASKVGRAEAHYAQQQYVGQNIHNLLAENVQTGVEAGRSYPGCPGNIDLAADAMKDTDSDGINRQEAYGGKGESDEDCEFVSRTCPECGAKNVITTVKKISETKKRIEGKCGCVKEYKVKPRAEIIMRAAA